MKEVLKLVNISKRFPGNQALSKVSVNFKENEIHGIVGKNGAGKSTLMNIIMGIFSANEGEIIFQDNLIDNPTPSTMIEMGITFVPQKLRMLNTLSVAENLFCGNLPKNKFGFIQWREVFNQANKALSKMGLDLDSRVSVQELSVEQRTMLVISKAVLFDSKIIILDEPTAVLNKKERKLLFEFIKKQKAEGISFIYISHHLEEIFEICDDVTVLVDGHSKGTYCVNDLNIESLINLMVGKNVDSYRRKKYINQKEKVLEVKNLTRRGCFEKINFDIYQGEILGICGLGSSGLNELIQSLYGMERQGVGEIKFDGKVLKNQTPSESMKTGIAFLTNDRHENGLINFRSLTENISVSILNKLSNWIFINTPKEKNIADDQIKKLQIYPPDSEKAIDLFSGGNQQKIIFGRLSVINPKLMLLQEPTQGVDVNAKNDIYRIIEDLSLEGISILIASSEIREMIDICDRIIVMNENKLIEEYTHHNFSLEKIMLTMEQGHTLA
jgi:ABC-type sugar transport system ATPase subunit